MSSLDAGLWFRRVQTITINPLIMIRFHPIQFLGYVQPEGSPCYKYGHLTQQVDYSADLSENLKRAFGYNNGERTLMFLLQSSNENFHNLVAAAPDARIIRTISNEPILTTQEQILVEHNLELLSHYAEKQLTTDANGKVLLDEWGMAIYTKDRLFLKGGMVDQDLRIPPCSADITDGDYATSTEVTQFFDFED